MIDRFVEHREATAAALGTAQTLAWGSSYYLPTILADPIAQGLGLFVSPRSRCRDFPLSSKTKE